MRSQDYWQIFLETGSPEVYLLFINARKMENTHVFDDTRSGTQSYSL